MRFFMVLLILLLAVWPCPGQERMRCAICAVTEGSGPEPVAGSVEYEGKTYYFCSAACQEKFALEPADWAVKFAEANRSEGPGNYGSLPDFELGSLKRADWQNKVMIIDFWATWCGPCVAEIPQFIELQKSHQDNLRLLAFSYDKEEETHNQFLKERALNYPSFLANSPAAKPFLRKLIKQVGPIKAIPVTLLVNRQGEIVYRQTGEINEAFKAAVLAELSK